MKRGPTDDVTITIHAEKQKIQTLTSFSIYCVAKHMKHNQSENVYNIVIRSSITFGGNLSSEAHCPYP